MSVRKQIRGRARGFSIVELMVAIALGGILMAGAVSLFVNNRDTSRFTSDLSQLQESGRFAMELMLRDIRMAGYFGCQNDLMAVNSLLDVDAAAGETGALWDTTFAIEGFDGNVDPTEWYPSEYADNLGDVPVIGVDGENGQIRAGTDAFVVRFLRGSFADRDGDGTPDREIADSTTTSLTAQNLDTAAFPGGEIVGVADCGGADVFIVDADATGNVVNVHQGAGGDKALAREYAAANRPMVAPYVARRYFVGTNRRGQPALFRATIDDEDQNPGTRNDFVELPQELFEGVENMQLLYGLDRNNDRAPDEFLPAGSTAGTGGLDDADDWRQVVAVKLSIMVRSTNQHRFGDGSVATQTLLDEDVIPPNDDRRRRVFTSMAVLRNLQ